MALSFNRNTKAIKGFASGVMLLSEVDTNGNLTGAFTQLDYTKSWTMTQEVDEFPEIDDSGAEVTNEESIKSIMVEGQFLSRDEKIRQMFMQTGTQSVKGKTYAIHFLGATYTDTSGASKIEHYFFPRVKFTQAIPGYAGGTGDAKFAYKFKAFKAETAVAYAAPTGLAWTGKTSKTGTITCAAGEWYDTTDLAAV